MTRSAFFIILGNSLGPARQLKTRWQLQPVIAYPIFTPWKEALLPKKKKRETSPDLRSKYMADGTAIHPVVNGKEIFPALVDHITRFDNLLDVLAGYDPQGFHRKSPGQMVELIIKLARHWADMYGLEYSALDKQAHADYSAERWSAHSDHYGDKV